MPHTGIRYDKSRPEVIRAVEDDIGRGDELVDIGGINANRDLAEAYVRIDLGEATCQHLDLALTDVGGAEQELATEIRLIDTIEVSDNELADAGCRNVGGNGIAQSAGANDKNLCIKELTLSLAPDIF